MSRPSRNTPWTLAVLVIALLTLFPAALAQQKAETAEMRDMKPDDRILQLIIEQAGQVDFDGDAFDAVNEENVIKTVSKALENRKGLSDEMVRQLLFARGHAYLKKKDADAAKKDADELCAARPKDAEARWLRALALFRPGREEESLAEAKEAVNLQPKSAKIRYFYAFLRFTRGDERDGDISASLAAIDAAIEMDPKYPPPYYLKAYVIFSLAHDPVECVKAVNQYLELAGCESNRRLRRACQWKGDSLRELNRQREAVPCFLAALRLDPKDLTTGEHLAMTYFELEKFHLAAHYAEELIRLDPNDIVGYHRAALAYAKLGRMKDARAMVQKVVPMVRNDPRLFGHLGDAFVAVGEYVKGRDCYDKAIGGNPGRFQFMWMVNKASLLATCPDPKTRDGKTAVELAELALKGPDGKGCFYWQKWRATMALAEAHAECGNFDKAVEVAKEATKLAGPDFPRRQEFLDKMSLFEKKTAYRTKVITD